MNKKKKKSQQMDCIGLSPLKAWLALCVFYLRPTGRMVDASMFYLIKSQTSGPERLGVELIRSDVSRDSGCSATKSILHLFIQGKC